ncbi:hypothetical protein [Pseudocnuella soli]|uniref:hypothetical protein n=1 Tax=Pseudocnuella soli TaxID=2502779 RepID=UPI001F00A0C8|nr:hypothetical protein [Pseudocnuella soli]
MKHFAGDMYGPFNLVAKHFSNGRSFNGRIQAQYQIKSNTPSFLLHHRSFQFICCITLQSGWTALRVFD